MIINIYRRDECHKAKGLCVVIDVLRAFTTAAYAFDAGAKRLGTCIANRSFPLRDGS